MYGDLTILYQSYPFKDIEFQYIPAKGIAGGLAGLNVDPETKLTTVPSTADRRKVFIVKLMKED